MSKTPLTDRVASYEGNWDTKALRMTAHARRLELENNELKARLDEAKKELIELQRYFLPLMRHESHEAKSIEERNQDD